LRGERDLTLSAAEKIADTLNLELAAREPAPPAEPRGPKARRKAEEE
jgi:hypothetical protein